MKKITEQMSTAFANGVDAKNGNDKVTIGELLNTYQLHNNIIAMVCPTAKNESKNLVISLCGFNTVTTRDRLNGIIKSMGLNARVFQKNFIPYLEVNGEIIQMSKYGFHAVSNGEMVWEVTDTSLTSFVTKSEEV